MQTHDWDPHLGHLGNHLPTCTSKWWQESPKTGRKQSLHLQASRTVCSNTHQTHWGGIETTCHGITDKQIAVPEGKAF